MRSFGRLLNSRYLTVTPSFEITEKDGVIYDNKEGKTMIERLLRSINNKTTELETFKSLVIYYNDENGINQDINLLKNQKGFEVEIDFNTIKKNSQWYDCAKPYMDEIMSKL